MINVALFNALVRLALAKGLGEVTVVNEDKQATYDLPQIADTTYNLPGGKEDKKKKLYADVPGSGWGEVYKLNCPKCGDRRQRLYVCHLFGQQIKYKHRDVLFSRRLYICHNEHCRLEDFLVELAPDPNDKRALAPKRVKAQLDAAVPLPVPLLMLSNEQTPPRVPGFLIGRGFDPVELERTWNVGYLPKGARYRSGEQEIVFREERLFIPIYNRRRLLYWQARVLLDAEWQRLKYLNVKRPDSLGKSSLLYNMDNAWRYSNVTIVEGVSDVWRIGPDAVAIFGTHISDEQMRLMKLLWGHCGSACVCLDGDAYDKAQQQAERLRKAEVFPHGVTAVKLDEDRDPADYAQKEIRQLLGQAFASMEQQAIAKEMQRVFHENNARDDLFIPAEQDGFN